MNKRRCPWCGKIMTDGGTNDFKFNSKKTPKPLYCGKCIYCNNYAAQMYSLRELILFIIAVVLFVLICIINYNLIAFGILILGLISIYAIKTARLRRINENEEYVVPESKVYSAVVLSEINSFKDEVIYLTDADFDEKQLYSTSSPIRLVKINRKEKEIEFYFLYEHKDN